MIRTLLGSLSVRIVLGMILGCAVGFPLGVGAAPLGEIGRVIIQLIKAVATPLLFFSILHSLLHAEVRARDGIRLFGFAAMNACFALAIGLSLSNYFQPGAHLNVAELKIATTTEALQPRKLDFAQVLSGFVPTSVVQPFLENAIIPVVLFALLFGLGLRRLRREDPKMTQVLESAIDASLRILQTVMIWIIQLIPLGVFGIVAKSSGAYGFAPVRGLAAYLAVGVTGFALQALLIYQPLIVWLGGIPLRKFWREARVPIVYAAGANSSLATLPVTLKALDRLGVSRQASTLGACVGTNLNHDGIVLYEAMAVLFVAQAHGIHLSIGQQALAAGSCVVAAMGIAGIPEAGFISLSLVLGTVGLPIELLPLLLTVDWILARGRSVGNVLSDIVVSVLLDRKPVSTVACENQTG